MDVFFVGVAAQHQFKFGCGNDFADDVQHVVAYNPFGRREIADAHLDDPAFDVRDFIRAPLLDVLLHRDVLGLPVIVLHRLVQIVRPLVFEWEDVEEHRLLAVDHSLTGVGLLGFFAIQ